MTIVVALKVGDGLVLGADSATTLSVSNAYHNTYLNTEKLMHVNGLPIGALTFGMALMKNRSVSSLANDLRARFASDAADWAVDPLNFTVQSIVERFQRFYFNELYEPEFRDSPDASPLGFIIGGYSSGQDSADVWRLILTPAGSQVERMVAPEAPWDCVWEGEREPIQRVLFGYSSQIEQRLLDAGVERDVAQRLLASMEPLINGAMPIQDAIDMVHYFIELTCGYVRFSPGPATVAKPIDLAAITKYNGFKWVARKHYYPAHLNA